MTLMFLHAVHLSSRVFFVIFKYKAANLPIHARLSGIFVPCSQPRHWLYKVSEVKRDLLRGCVSRSV